MESSQEFGKRYSLKNRSLMDRYSHTLHFLKKNVAPPASILDLGITNLFTQIMVENGYSVSNTEKGLDLDDDYDKISSSEYDIVTAFEIFEHLLAPYNILKDLQCKHLVVSVPLKLWFADAYWNKDDPWDRHYHEFEPKQFDMLLEKSGWKIQDRQLEVSRSYKLGIRPLLRRLYPRYYFVYCTR